MRNTWPILIVDDEEVMCESMAAWLREDGYRVDTASNGRRAVELAAATDYAIYFVDLKMPGGMDGIDTMMEIRKLRQDASIIIITAYATVDTAIQAMKEGAQEYIAKIDDMGGALQSIEMGFMQNEIQNAAYAAQQAIERGEQVVVGVNQFTVEESLTLERLKVDPAIELGQRERLKALRETRDQRLVDELLGKLVAAAKGTENLMPLFIECVENDITLGEVCNTLRGVWGEYVAEGF